MNITGQTRRQFYPTGRKSVNLRSSPLTYVYNTLFNCTSVYPTHVLFITVCSMCSIVQKCILYSILSYSYLPIPAFHYYIFIIFIFYRNNTYYRSLAPFYIALFIFILCHKYFVCCTVGRAWEFHCQQQLYFTYDSITFESLNINTSLPGSCFSDYTMKANIVVNSQIERGRDRAHMAGRDTLM